MFRIIIKNTIKLAHSINCKAPSDEAVTAINHIATFEKNVVPKLTGFADRCDLFVQKSSPIVNKSLEAIKAGSLPKSLVADCASLQAEALTLRNESNLIHETTSAVCISLSTDIGKLQSYVGKLEVRIASLRADSDRKKREADELHSKISITQLAKYIPFVGSIGTSIAEMTGLIESVQSLESKLAKLIKKTSKKEQEARQIRDVVINCTHFEDQIKRLVSAGQSLENTVTVLGGKLNNAENFIQGADEMPKLYLLALQSSLKQLEQIAS